MATQGRDLFFGAIVAVVVSVLIALTVANYRQPDTDRLKHMDAYRKWAKQYPDEDERMQILTAASTRPTKLPFPWGNVSGPDVP